MQRVEPTHEELHSAWLHCRRDSWPATFEAAMADALCSRIVRLTAMHPPLPLRRVIGAAVPMPLQHAAHRPARFDAKRAAAGDRDD